VQFDIRSRSQTSRRTHTRRLIRKLSPFLSPFSSGYSRRLLRSIPRHRIFQAFLRALSRVSHAAFAYPRVYLRKCGSTLYNLDPPHRTFSPKHFLLTPMVFSIVNTSGIPCLLWFLIHRNNKRGKGKHSRWNNVGGNARDGLHVVETKSRCMK
jgi:hypothetical protein